MTVDADFYIFRDVRRRTDAATLAGSLRSELARLSSGVHLDELLALLLRAGELECALEDAHVPAVESAAAFNLTDAFANAALRCDSSSALPYDRDELRRNAWKVLDDLRSSCALHIGTPEGFAYYALHPLGYAGLAGQLELHSTCAVVIGIRSIGTTLSAVIASKLRQIGIAAERMTVRPTGHPYQRQSRFALWQKQVIARAIANGAHFLICDEGPGRSGSSLLSVAEALEALSVPAERILIICSHQPSVETLCAPQAARRWSRFRSAATGTTRRLPADAHECLGGGEWRRVVLATNQEWPAVWPQMERLRYLSRDRQSMLTFEGYGHYGEKVRKRNEALAASGFGVSYLGHQAGFGKHTVMPVRARRRASVTPDLLAHMAAYCAWRAEEFRADHARSGDLESMVRANYEREFDRRLKNIELPIERPAICDNRVSPHYWLLAADGRWLKLDGAIHGDDHFFPGPCDIAWDLAGLIVEWNLDQPAREQLLANYARKTGDDVVHRIGNYEIAYTTFRMAWSKMALPSAQGSEEEPRLAKDDCRYQRLLQRLTTESSGKHSAVPASEDILAQPASPNSAIIAAPPAAPLEDQLL